jgi:Zn2+/Cd2+-exporting ATPase
MLFRSRRSTSGAPQGEESCADIMQAATAGAEGIVGVELDTHHGRLVVAYDPEAVSEDRVAHVVDMLADPFESRFATCSLRIGRQGGRACESCAEVFERRLRRVSGIRAASVSFRGGVLKLTYDDTTTSRDQILTRVRHLGV